jgi:hypothetical protein
LHRTKNTHELCGFSSKIHALTDALGSCRFVSYWPRNVSINLKHQG